MLCRAAAAEKELWEKYIKSLYNEQKANKDMKAPANPWVMLIVINRSRDLTVAALFLSIFFSSFFDLTAVL